MTIAGSQRRPLHASGFATRAAGSNAEAGHLIVGLGAILLFVSLFLNWYRRGLDAWSAFEAWDLILAAIAILALVAVLSRLGYGAQRPNSWLVGPSLAALIIVAFVTVNPPPIVAAAHASGTGLWLGLVASVLMAVGAVLSVARVSVSLATAPPSADAPAARHADAYTEPQPLDRVVTPTQRAPRV